MMRRISPPQLPDIRKLDEEGTWLSYSEGEEYHGINVG
jgi:hypothetical protein